MKVLNKLSCKPFLLLLAVAVMMAIIATPSVGIAAATRVDLGTASSFAILAGSTITNTGPTTISGSAGGDIGLHPGADPTILTFPGQELITTTGTVHLFDAVAQQAKADLLTAYNSADAQTTDVVISADLGGTTLTPGVYTSASSISITGILTLDGGGDPNAVFVFQAGSTLTTLANSEIRLINGAQASGVFWQVGSSATLGVDSVFVGTILAMESITATTTTDVNGRLLALNGAVTLDTITMINEAPGSLTVTKVVSGDVGDMVLPSFDVTVTGPEGFTATRAFVHGESFTWQNLVPGEYTVTESRAGLSSEWTVSGEGTVQVVANEIAVATISNSYIAQVQPTQGALTVTKVVSGAIGDMTLPSFAITVTGPEGFVATRTLVHGESFTWQNLIPGAYTVTESRTGLSSEWTVSGEGAVQVIAGETALTTISNSYVAEVAPPYGALTVAKVVSGAIGDMTLPLYRITVTGPQGFVTNRSFVHGESFTWQNLVPGAYTVTESRTGLSSEWTVSGEGTVQVIADETALTTISNSYLAETVPPYGTLTVAKLVSGEVGDMTLPLFRIIVTGPQGFVANRTFVHGESFTWQNLVPGVYTVTESRTGLSSEWTVSGEGTVQVIADETALTTISNSYIAETVPAYGTFTVTKMVSGDVGAMTLPLFRITVTGPQGFVANRTFVHGESFTWQNLVPGVYTVTESRTGLSNDWTISGEGTVQVIADQTALATVSNNYLTDVVDVGPGELPDTGENTLLTTYSGLLLLGLGLLLWWKRE